MILITGHPRSGTGYMAALAQACGLDIQHEAIGADGISSWMMAPPVWRVPFHRTFQHRGRNWYRFNKVIEVVRDPLATIASVATTENVGSDEQNTSLWWRAMWTPIDLARKAEPITQAVVSIVEWHRMIKVWLPDVVTVKLENARKTFPRIIGRPMRGGDPGVVNGRKHAVLRWDQVRSACDDELWGRLQEYKSEVGYV
jgi:hypothetical protein